MVSNHFLKTFAFQPFSKKEDLLSKLIQVTDFPVIICTLVLSLLVLLTPENKIFFLLTAFYIGALFAITKSLVKTLLYSFFPLLSFSIGQLYVINVLPPQILKHPLYPDGRNLYFYFSPFLVLLMTSVSAFLLQIFRSQFRINLPFFGLFLLISQAVLLISTLQVSFFPLLSFGYAITQFGVVTWLLLGIHTLAQLPDKQKKKVYITFFFILLILALVETSVVILQSTNRSTLGLKIEQSTIIPAFGQGSDENPLQFRPIGLRTHANELANLYLTFLFSFLFLWEWVKKSFTSRSHITLLLIAVGSCLFNILISQSRAAYLSLGISLMVLVILNWHTFIKARKILLDMLDKNKIFILLFMLYFSFVIPDRVLHTLYSFTPTGGFLVRHLLEKEAIELINKFPIWGAGMGMFIPAAYENHPFGIIKYFPESVHNGFLLLLVEHGVIYGLMLVLMFYFLLRKLFFLPLSRLLKTTMISSIIASMIMMFFHPFINTFAISMTLLYLIIGSTTVNHEKLKKK